MDVHRAARSSCWEVNLPECSGSGFHLVLCCIQLPLHSDQSLCPDTQKQPPSARQPSPWFTVEGCYWDGDQQCLVSSKHDKVSLVSIRPDKTCFSHSEYFTCFSQSPVGLQRVVYWGDSSVWPLWHEAEAGDLLELSDICTQDLWSPAFSRLKLLLLHVSYPQPRRALPVFKFFPFHSNGGHCALGNLYTKVYPLT